MPTARSSLYRRHRFPPEVISYAVWLYYRFPLSLRMVEGMLAARGICVTYETVRQWGKKFGKAFADPDGFQVRNARRIAVAQERSFDRERGLRAVVATDAGGDRLKAALDRYAFASEVTAARGS